MDKGADAVVNTVTLLNNGSIIENGKTVENDPLRFLGYKVQIENDYTLRGYFRLFDRYPLLTKLDAFFSTYMEQYRSSPESGCTYNGFDYLELSKTVEMVGFPGKPRLEIYNLLRGVCGKERCDLRSVQLEDILDMQLSLGTLKHIVFGDKVDLFEFDTAYNLFEFIDSILWELGFHGTLKACQIRR